MNSRHSTNASVSATPSPAPGARRLVCSLALAIVSASAVGQNMTSPPGHLTTEGTSWYNDLAGGMAGYYTHVVHVDQSLTAFGAHQIRRLYLRRDGTRPTNPTYSARMLPVEVRMAQADFSRIVNGNAIDDTALRLTPWQTVFADRSVSLPSFVDAPATGPAAWSVSLPLDTPYGYQPTSALAIHLRFGINANVTPSEYPFDATGEYPSQDASGTRLGTGCQVTGQPGRMTLDTRLFNYGDVGSQTHLRCDLFNALTNSPWIMAMGLTDPNLAFGACSALRTSGEVLVGGPATSATGRGILTFDIRHHVSLIGARVFFQAAQGDPGQGALPIALANGSQLVYPVNPTLPPHAVSVSWSPSPSFGVGHSFYKGGTLVFGFDW